MHVSVTPYAWRRGRVFYVSFSIKEATGKTGALITAISVTDGDGAVEITSEENCWGSYFYVPAGGTVSTSWLNAAYCTPFVVSARPRTNLQVAVIYRDDVGTA